MPGVLSWGEPISPTPAGVWWNDLDDVWAPMSAARSFALSPLAKNNKRRLSPAACMSGSFPSGAGTDESFLPTKVLTFGPSGHVITATFAATTMVSATPTFHLCARFRSLVEISWRPLFSLRVKASFARMREPSQPPVLPWSVDQVPQSWNTRKPLAHIPWEVLTFKSDFLE